jgi:hypothetical protein
MSSTMNRAKKHRALASLAGLAALLLVGSASLPANAVITSGQTVSCTVDWVQYSGDLLDISCGGILYSGYGPGWTTCATRQNAETMRAFNQIVTSTFLSGKKLLINWQADSVNQACGGPNRLNTRNATLFQIHN